MRRNELRYLTWGCMDKFTQDLPDDGMILSYSELMDSVRAKPTLVQPEQPNIMESAQKRISYISSKKPTIKEPVE